MKPAENQYDNGTCGGFEKPPGLREITESITTVFSSAISSFACTPKQLKPPHGLYANKNNFKFHGATVVQRALLGFQAPDPPFYGWYCISNPGNSDARTYPILVVNNLHYGDIEQIIQLGNFSFPKVPMNYLQPSNRRYIRWILIHQCFRNDVRRRPTPINRKSLTIKYETHKIHLKTWSSKKKKILHLQFSKIFHVYTIGNNCIIQK